MAEVLILPQEEIAREVKAQVLALLDSAWPSDRSVAERLSEPLHDPGQHPRAVILIENGTILGYLAIPSTTIHHAGYTSRASGLSAVVTHPAQRQRGHGRRIVAAAREYIAASDADIGVFTCDSPLVPFYTRCGWTPMARTELVGGTRAKPFPAAPLGKRTMMGFFSAQAQGRRGDFEIATIYLELREGDLW